MVTTEGFVFQNIKYGETSVIARIYTRELSVITCMIKGARRSGKKSGLANLYQPLSYLSLVLPFQENKNFQHIKEARFKKIYQRIGLDPVRTQMALFLLEVFNNALRTPEINQATFDFVADTILHIDSVGELNPNTHLWTLLKLTQFIGIEPENNHSSRNIYFDYAQGSFCEHYSGEHYVDSDTSEYIAKFLSLDRDQLKKITLNRNGRNGLLDVILQFYRFHLEGFKMPKSQEIIRMLY